MILNYINLYLHKRITNARQRYTKSQLFLGEVIRFTVLSIVSGSLA